MKVLDPLRFRPDILFLSPTSGCKNVRALLFKHLFAQIEMEINVKKHLREDRGTIESEIFEPNCSNFV